MYGVIRTRQFERAFRKLRKSGHMSATLRNEIDAVVFKLASKEVLSARFRDHGLTGELEKYRECHIRGDLLLVYEIKHDKLVLVLIDIGTHSEIFG